MKRPMIINVFEACSPGFMPPGMWQNPEDESFNYLKIEHWSKLAKLLERGRFDGIFLADILGNLDIYGGGLAAALTSGMVTPCNDPLMIIPSMAQVTEHLGFGVTASLSYEPPYLFARKMSTLDHLTNGRIGWNVVTSYLDSAARALGLDRQLPHEERYRVAEEYMELMYKLWEGSWEDDAVIRDRTSGVYAKPELVHPVSHRRNERPLFIRLVHPQKGAALQPTTANASSSIPLPLRRPEELLRISGDKHPSWDVIKTACAS